MTRAETLEQEKRWALPVGIASILGVLLLTLSGVVDVSGDGQADLLRSADADSGAVLLSGLIQTLGFLLLMMPLVYLFRAARARSDQVRSQLIGLVVVAPLFFAVSSSLSIGVTNEAADKFVAGDAEPTLSRQEAKEECADERREEGNDFLADEYDPAKGEAPQRACEERKLEDDAASNALGEASLAPLAAGLGLAGVLGLIASLLYIGLWAMRTGLLSRFWGALGMVSGIAFVLGPLSVVSLVWFVYFGLLVLGAVPGGKPPAWQAGEAIPWPTPGEKAAAEMEPDEGWDESEGEGEEPGEKRKRKRRE